MGSSALRAIFDFFYDKFSLSRHIETDELVDLTYSELPEEWQSRFISYSISIDLFLAATPDEVVQVFRRMNSYTVPLNPEELRNAEYQGAFKWFIYEKSGKYAAALTELGVFGAKGLVRMQSNLAKPYMLYSLALALIDSMHPIPNFEPFELAVDFESISLERRLLELSAALDLDEDQVKDSPFREFIAASRDKTNVKVQRETRVRWFIKALSGAKA